MDAHAICFDLKYCCRKTHILWLWVMAVTHPADLFVVPENQNRRRETQSEHPECHQHPREHPAVGQRADTLRPHYRHQPVETHQHDQKYGSVHVGTAEVEQDFAQHQAENPTALKQINYEERRQQHEEAVGEGEVQDQEGGDGATPCSGQDAPDDEDVPGDADKEHEAEDHRASDRSTAVAQDRLTTSSHVLSETGRDKWTGGLVVVQGHLGNLKVKRKERFVSYSGCLACLHMVVASQHYTPLLVSSLE